MTAGRSVVLASLVFVASACGGDASRPRESEQAAAPLLAFTRSDGEGRSVWLLDADGSTRRVTSGGQPSWSPGGERLALVRATGSLVVYDLRTRRSSTRAGELAETAAWSRAGDGIALSYDGTETAAGAPWTVAVVSPRGARPARVVVASWEPVSYAWSPTRPELAYTDCTATGPERWDCRIVAVDVRAMRARLLGEARRLQPYGKLAWAPDATALALNVAPHSTATAPGSAGLWVLELATRRLTRIVATAINDFAWSPDSRSLAYATSWSGEGSRANGIDVVSRDGTRRARLVEPTAFVYRTLDWSATAGAIAAVTGDELSSLGLHVIDGTTGELLHRTRSGDTEPVWRPRASRLAVLRLRERN